MSSEAHLPEPEPEAPTPPEPSPAEAAEDEDPPESPGMELMYAAIFAASSAFLWWYFTDFESSTQTSRRMNAIVAMLYQMGGKWLPVGLFAAAAVWKLVAGVRGMRR